MSETKQKKQTDSILLSKTLQFYKQLDVQRALVAQAEHKEVSVHFQTYFSKRPDALFGEGDVLEFAKKKASSFHCSEELWSNPLFIKTGMPRKETNELRVGWDLILDIDCPYWPLSKLITYLFIQALEEHGIKSITQKFSGNKGFHIAVPFNAFPSTFNGTPTKDLFPEAPRRIARFLLYYLAKNFVEDKGDFLIFKTNKKKFKMSKEKLAKALDKEDASAFTKKIFLDDEHNEVREEDIHKFKPKISQFCNSCGFSKTLPEGSEPGIVANCPRCNMILQETKTGKEKIIQEKIVFDPLTIIEVDTILIAHRHLYRMPYSFHEKSHKVSIPVQKEDILSLSEDKEWANPDKVNFSIPFLERDQAVEGEATSLLTKAFDYDPDLKNKEVEKREFEIPEDAYPEDFFPPCIKSMLEGLKDGRKRALFTLINFLRGAGWSLDQIEEEITEWNKRNEEPLREVEIKGRIRYERTKPTPMPPHNCKRYYQDFGVCRPDKNCEYIKNPLQYAKRRAKLEGFGDEKKGGRQKLDDEQKAMRKAHREKLKKEKEEAKTPQEPTE